MKEINKIELGDKIRILREAAGETQSDLFEVLNYSNHQQVSFIERGERKASIDQIVALAHHFNVSTDYLLGLSDAPTTDKDLQFICDYTGLNQDTINFFAFNKSIEDVTTFNKTTIDFIEYFVDRIYHNSSFSFDIETMREMTTHLYLAYEKGLQEKSKPKIIDCVDETKTKEMVDDIFNRQIDEETLFEDVRNIINANKYTINRFISKCIEDFAVSNIKGFTASDLESIENEYYGKRGD